MLKDTKSDREEKKPRGMVQSDGSPLNKKEQYHNRHKEKVRPKHDTYQQ